MLQFPPFIVHRLYASRRHHMQMQLTYTGKGYIMSPPVLVRLLRHHPLQVVQHVTPPLVHNHSHRQVAEQVLRCQLDGSQVPAGEVYGCVWCR
jgi:hypothetical protein